MRPAAFLVLAGMTLVLGLTAVALLVSDVGKGRVQEELERIRAEGGPVTLEDVGLGGAGRQAAEWDKIAALSEKIKTVEKELPAVDLATMKPAGPGIARVRSRELFSFPPETIPKEFRDSMEKMRGMLEEVSLLAKTSEVGFIPDYRQGFAAKMPHVQAMISLTKARGKSAMAHVSSGEVDAALRDLKEGRRLKQWLLQRNTIVEGLVDMSCDNLLLGASWEILQRPGLTDLQLAELAGIWEETLEPGDILSFWQRERVCSWQTVSNIGRKDRSGISVDFSSEESRKRVVGKVTSGIYQAFFMQNDLQHYLEFFHRLEKELLEWKRTEKFASLKAESARQERFLGNLAKWELPRYYICILALPSTGKALETSAVIITQQRQLKAALALQRYRLAHSRYPESLSLLVPQYLPAVPRDPLDGQPLRYRMEKDGTYLLYSVGINGQDDEGSGEENIPVKRGERWRPSNCRDILWLQPQQKR